jgi:hypothetical protein
MIKLAAASGVVIYEDGPKLYISKTPAPWTGTFLFITGLLALILLINGVLQLFVVGEPNGSSRVGIILFGIGIFFTFLFWRVRVYSKRVGAIPFNELINIAVVDFESNNLFDGQQHILTPLHQAYLRRKMQLGSSSPELIMEWGHGSLSLVKGNPFSGGVSIIEKILLSKGIRKR